jgi:hypothetical protein
MTNQEQPQTLPLVIPVYEMMANQRVRLLLPYGGFERAFFWFAIGEDGSIYAGVRKKRFTDGKVLTKSASGNSTRLLYDEGDRFPADAKLGSKVSVHASGIVHIGVRPGFRSIRPPLRNLKEPALICVAVIEHPQNFEPVSSIRNRDVLTRYPIVEEMPLWMRIYAAPAGTAYIGDPSPGIAYRMTSLFQCSDLNAEMPKLSLQVDLCHGARGPWPPYSYMVFMNEAVGQF